MRNTYNLFLCLVVMLLLLSGCLYPDEELSKNQKPNETQLKEVQTAINQYKEKTDGLLPIQTKAEDTPIFRKHLIDFQLLKQENIMTEIPGTAYENGGTYKYTIITPDDDPRVKLIDLRISNTIRNVATQLNTYRAEHTYPPFGEEIADGVFRLDYEKLGMDSKPYVKSPYSQENLPIVMDNKGDVYVDYRIDLTKALSEYENTYKQGDDIRYILAENTPFVPAYSLPYTIQDGDPVFSQPDSER